MLKQKVRKFKNIFNARTAVAVLVVVLLAAVLPTRGFGVFAANCTSSSDCQQQIDALNAQNSQTQQTVNDLAAQASSYQGAIDSLNQQINDIQQQIVSSQNQYDQLQAEIAQKQADLDQQKKVLGEDIKAMYLEGQISTLEILASSSNLSDFVNKEVGRSAVQNKVKSSVDEINTLKLQLQQQENQVAQLLKTQQAQRDQLASDENQQSQLLAYNEDQQAQFDQQIKANKTALSQLYAKQNAIIAASFGGGGYQYGGTGGYPWSDAQPLGGIYDWGYSSGEFDPAGWVYRNCTSYAFWRLAQTTGASLTWNFFPSVYNSGGEIKYSAPIGDSAGDFRNLGYTVNHDPNGTAVLAVNTAGAFGHIMYVEAVVNGNAFVSQYNAEGRGLYSTGTLSSSDNIWFVHIR